MLAAVLAVLSTAAPAVPTPAAAPDPYAIFARARAAWEHQRYPRYLSYDVVMTVEEGGRERVLRYAAAYDNRRERNLFDPISREERSHPHVTHNVPSLCINLVFTCVRVTKPEPPVDLLGGPPALAPNYGFGIGVTPSTPPRLPPTPEQIVADVRRDFHDPNPRASAAPQPSPSPGLPVIAVTASEARSYRITYEGETNVDGSLAYRLALEPVREATRYRLRELWIDEASFAPLRARIALNFAAGPGTQVPWTILFEQRDGVTYVRSETAGASMRYRGLIYTGARVDFENLEAIDALPTGLAGNQSGDALLLATPGAVLQEPPF